MTQEIENQEIPADATPPDLNELDKTSEIETTPSIEEEAPKSPAQRVRDETGKFAKKTFREQLEINDGKQAEPIKPITTTAKKYEAPQNWKDTDKQLFATVPDAVKDAWLLREKEYESGIGKKSQEFAPLKKEYDEISQVLTPFAGQMQQLGMRPAQAIHELVNIWQQQHQFMQNFRANPQAAIQHLAQIAGIDVSPLMAEDYSAPPQVQLPPEVAQQLALVPQLQSRLDQYEQGNINQTIQQFATQKDSTGKLMRQHFDEVRQHMSALIGSGVAQTLEEAYSQAIYANPTVRAKLDAEKAKAEQLERQKKAQQAQRAGDSIKTGNGAASNATGAMTFRQRLEYNDRQIGAV